MSELLQEIKEKDIIEIMQEMIENSILEGSDTAGDSLSESSSAGDAAADKGLLSSGLLDERIVRAVEEMGFEKFSPIQEQAIPVLLEGKDIIGQAQTGTGKTAAFGIPLIQKIDPQEKGLQAVILCPTRELAIQAAQELRKLAKYMHGIKVLPVYGGQDISRQITGLKGTQIIVGTPGRVMDHMRRHTIKLDQVSMVVLDEADEMLNMGFREDMELILGSIPGEHQTALFSATMPKPILEITGKFQKEAQFIKVAAEELTIPLVSQRFYRIKNADKDAACIRILEFYQPGLCLIFCNTKKKVDELTEFLRQHGYRAEGLHGDMSQAGRDAAMNRFRHGSTDILVATDVAARGIDVDDVAAVINYDIPQDVEYYVHRIGRTGRAGKTGRSFTLASARELFRIREIERICHTQIEEKKLPDAARVMRAKAEKLLDQVWEQGQQENMEEMKEFLLRKIQKENCDPLDMAAALLKHYVGEKSEEIETDEYRPSRSGRRRGDRRGRDGEASDRRRGYGRSENFGEEGEAREGRRRRRGEKPEEGKEPRESRRHGRSEKSEEGREPRENRRRGRSEKSEEGRELRESRRRGRSEKPEEGREPRESRRRSEKTEEGRKPREGRKSRKA